MADRIIYNLDHDGRFSMRLEDILDPTGGPGQLAVAQKALAMVQRLDPPAWPPATCASACCCSFALACYYEQLKTLITSHLEDLDTST